ncbi:xylulokinase [Desulforamulus putei]|uniref:Xylulose kinase n=1 Tax=Desulforamulus putei DSM 12395 TaxID=1121429 RepID=A0A1M4UQR3_9FIRM|nr:xylulokinase [Desulforamulus putei]SHE59029.1 xylulokinase [Desulforamulus putei DSM 12395]
MQGLFLGIDIGTTGVKALVMDEQGQVVFQVTREYPLHVPRPGWAEQDPEDWYKATCDAVATILSRGISPGRIQGIGLTGQMHGSVFLDAQGRVIREAILWCDQRTADECRQITDLVGESGLIALVSNPALAGFTAPKILWLRNHEPENYRRVAKVLLPKDYIGWRLTGVFATDVSDASGMLLLDVVNRKWSAEMLAALEIPGSWLAEVFESPEVVGRVNVRGAAETGLPVGTPVVAGAGDNAAGAVGNGIIRPGMATASLGTSGVVFTPSLTPAVDQAGRLHTFCHAVPGQWHLMGVTMAAGGSLRWYRDTFAGEERAVAQLTGKDPYELLNDEAALIEPGSEGLLFLPYLSGERTPHADPLARGVFVGMSLKHTKGHFVRSIMEGVAFSLKDTVEIMSGLGIALDDLRITGGGGRSPVWRQILADVLNMPLHVMENSDGPAYGAAILGAVGAGCWNSVPEAVAATCSRQQLQGVTPIPQNAARYQKIYQIYADTYPPLKPLFKRLGEIY